MKKQIIGVSVAAAALMALAVAPKTESEAIYHREPIEISVEVYTDTATGTYIEPEEEPEIEFNGELAAVNVFPEPTPEPEPVYQPTYTTNDGWTYYGVCTVTHYCNCPICCGKWAGGNTASGVYPTSNHTVAMDLPFGTEVLINGQVYVVEDRGVSGAWVDIYVDTHDEAIQRGMYTADVYVRW